MCLYMHDMTTARKTGPSRSKLIHKLRANNRISASSELASARADMLLSLLLLLNGNKAFRANIRHWPVIALVPTGPPLARRDLSTIYVRIASHH